MNTNLTIRIDEDLKKKAAAQAKMDKIAEVI